MIRPSRPWKDLSAAEKRAAVKPMILAGKSYVEIARVLQISNRNSVAGVVTRLRELGELPPARSKKAVGKDGGQVVRANAQARRKPKASGLDAINIAVRAENRAEAPGIAISRAAAFDPLPGQIPAAFVENHGCRWPVDGIDGPGLLACGAAKEPEHVYCADHRRLAYVPRITRQKAASRAAERLS